MIPTVDGWITLATLGADVLRSPARSKHRAGRDWCRRHGVPYRMDGRHGWVRLDDVTRAIASTGAAAQPENDRSAAAAAAWAKMRSAG